MINKLKWEELSKRCLRANDDLQNIHTPYELCEEIISKIDFNNKSVLVLFNFEFVYKLLEKGIKDITLYTHSSYKKQICDKLSIKNIYKQELSKLNMKFDVVIGNPPFNNDKSTNKKANMGFYNSFVDTARKLSKQHVYLVGPVSYLYKSKDKGIYELNTTEAFTNIALPICWVKIDSNKKQNTFVDKSILYKPYKIEDSIARRYVGNTGTIDTGVSLYSKLLTDVKQNDNDVEIHTSINKIKYTNNADAIKVFKNDNSYGYWRIIWTMMEKNLERTKIIGPNELINHTVFKKIVCGSKKEAENIQKYLQGKQCTDIIDNVRKATSLTKKDLLYIKDY